MSEYPFTVRPLSTDEGGGYLIEFPDLPGCMSDGDTVEEAIRNGEDAKRDWIAAMREVGRPIPVASVEPTERYSGKWQLRTPKSLHRKLAEHAQREGVSLNALAVSFLAEGLGQRNGQVGGMQLGIQHALQKMLENAPRDVEEKSPRKERSRRGRRGTNARLVEEVLQASAPRALRPAEIRSAIQRDKGVAVAFTSIRHALGQLAERHVAEPVPGERTRRYRARSGASAE